MNPEALLGTPIPLCPEANWGQTGLIWWCCCVGIKPHHQLALITVAHSLVGKLENNAAALAAALDLLLI